MIQPAKAPRNKRTRVLLVIGAVLAACAAFLPQLGIASAAPGDKYNTSKACEGAFEDKASKLRAFKSFNFYVDGKLTSTEYREVSKLVKPGSDIKVTFELKPECDNTFVGIDVYALPSDGFKVSEASQQRLLKRVGGAFSAGKVHTLTNTLPECWFQFDVYTGWEYKPGDFTLDNRGRLLLAGVGGSELCENKPAATTSTTQRPSETTTTTKAPTTTTTSTTSTTVAPSETTTTTKPRPTTTKAPATTTSTTVVKTERKPSATVRQVCDVDGSGWTTQFKNDGNVSETFIVKDGDKRLDVVTVAAGKSTSRTYTFEEAGVSSGESIRVTVEANGVEVADRTVVNDCVNVAASAVVACDTAAGSGAVLTFSNAGKIDETFTVTRDGSPVTGSPVTVPAGTAQQRSLLTMNEDETARIVITGEQSDLRVERTLTLNCVEVQPVVIAPTTTTTSTTAAPPVPEAPAEVLGAVVVRPQLAETGFNPTYYAIGGLFLLAIGGLLLRSARRLRFTA